MARPKELGSIIQQILSPTPGDAETLLEEIGLGAIPSREQVHQEIDAKLLSPPDTLPNHWLSTYQMYGSLASGFVNSSLSVQTLENGALHTLLAFVRACTTTYEFELYSCRSGWSCHGLCRGAYPNHSPVFKI